MSTRLGYHVLVVMDHDPTSNLGLINALIHEGSDLSNRYITLMCCCPATYWEHGAGTSSARVADLERELAQNEERQNRSPKTADQMFAKAGELLENAGVPAENISTLICYEGDSLAAAVIRQLESHHYSTVVVERRHQDVVNRLSKRGIWRLFTRHIPDVSVWAVDVANEHIPA